MRLLVIAAAALVAWGVTTVLAPPLAARSHLVERNHRGLPVATGLGIAVVLGVTAALGVLAILPNAVDGSHAARAVVTWPFAAALGVAALLGAWHDLAGPDPAGWGQRAGALRARRPTAGALQLGGIIVLALVVAPPAGLGRRLLAAGVVVLGATLFDALDAAPGRAAKTSLLLGVPVAVAATFSAPDAAPLVVALLAAVAAFLPIDLRERGTLGHLGAFSIGAALGLSATFVSSTPVLAFIALALLALHAVAARDGGARLMGAGPLGRLDRLGRVSIPAG